jgi:poly-gamma-glutamate capsule biosynthesis protein CapA/YwtB (metallophosphatase superfamily)
MQPPVRPANSVALAIVALVAVACASSASGSAAPQSAGPPPGAQPTPAVESSAAATGAPASGNVAPARLVRISAVGDTILGSTPNLPADPQDYLSSIDKALRDRAQIVFGNLEGTLTAVSSGKCGGSNSRNCFAFRNPPHYAKYLAADGFTLLNDANNHSHDFGQAGLDQTVRAIHKAGMKQTGLVGEITVVHAGAVKVAFLGFAPYPNTADLLRLTVAKSMIQKAHREAPVVVVYMHAGAEGSTAEHVTGHEEFAFGEDRGNAEKFAKMAIRSGASLVIASGPHVVRGMEFYRRHLIAYSLGNFANFHNFASGGILSDSSILRVSLTAAGDFHSARLYGVLLDGEGHPTLGGGTVSLVRALSRDDFGDTRAHFGADGTIHPPAP